MKITRENIDAVNAVLKVDIVKADYEKTVAHQLKEYRQKAVVPGFRPGKVPDGLIKRKYRIPILVEEVNKLLSKNLSQYLVDEKLNILGEPLPNEEQQKNINWETDENFEFVFDIALAPELNILLDKQNEIKYYKISVSEEMINQQIETAQSQLGQNIPDDEIKTNFIGKKSGDVVIFDPVKAFENRHELKLMLKI